MAKRKRRRARRQQEDYPGWVWMLFGLAIGLSVAFAIYMKDNEPVVALRPAEQAPASMAAAIDDSDNDTDTRAQAEAAPTGRRFDFYNMLPNFEVVIPEQETNVGQGASSDAALPPGIYVLQAGSFAEYVDADRRRAQIALQGIESRIQKVSIDDKTYHRVRIGPLDDVDEMNRIRDKLRRAKIDVLRIRLGD